MSAGSLEDASAEPMDELRRLAYRLMPIDQRAAEAVHSIVGSLTAPLQVLVAGRSGVGRSAVVRLLESDNRAARRVGGAPVIPTETRAFDVPGAIDPDLTHHCVVYVVVDGIRDVDRRAARRLSDRGLVVVNKADRVGDGWEAAVGRATEIAHELGTATVPLVALTGEGGGAFFDALARIVEAQWWRRVDGMRAVLERVAAGADADEAGAQDEVERYLGADSGVTFAATAALVRPELKEFVAAAPALPETVDEALRCATWWGGQAQREHPSWPDAVSLVQRAYVRRWASLGGRPAGSEGAP
ncbi:GTPase domain-containing protein [Rhodococcus sp. IEGM 1379]|uniref:GTPase domain-containing protein n=1 Tax=Rhodococcus sp. IEGM 1379 TaxID=3047086 RepID=UPI0024B76F6D|nr:GTPase domain-containing protein [Rhodococcus sp. IEGM 1379]